MSAENQKPGLTEQEKKLLQDLLSDEEGDLSPFGEARRHFLKTMTVAGGGMLAVQLLNSSPLFAHPAELTGGALPTGSIENSVNVAFNINGIKKAVTVDSRMTLLDTLREQLQLTGSKKGCDHGQCGACTVIVDGRRVLSCLTLAATCTGKKVTTIEGLAAGGALHPMQAAFIKHDGFQCGYCTSGQICSAVALLDEAKRGELSYVSPDMHAKAAPLPLSDEEIRERMSGNICRCGAYPNIVDAIREVHSGREVAQHWHFIDQQPEPGVNSQVQKGGTHASI